MPLQTSGGLGLPKFQRNEKQKKWVASERRTAKLIRSLWKAAGYKQRSDPAFLRLLIQCGWNTGGRKSGGDSTRRWRNQKIAEYLNVHYVSDAQLAQDLHSHFKSLGSSRKCLSIVRERTGIALYYKPYYPATLEFIKQHSGAIALAFKRVSVRSADVFSKVRGVATLIESLGEFDAAGKPVSPFKGLTPSLSCLDPQGRFPIMNQRTSTLLRGIQKKADMEGAVALAKLTTTPNAVSSEVHDRMPVILDPDSYDIWLDPGMRNVTTASELLKPYDARLMRCYPISTRINHVANDDEECSARVELAQIQNSLFS